MVDGGGTSAEEGCRTLDRSHVSAEGRAGSVGVVVLVAVSF